MSDNTEDKIVLDTKLYDTIYTNEVWISLASLGMVMAEIYQKANDIGWETKALDALNDELRRIHNV